MHRFCKIWELLKKNVTTANINLYEQTLDTVRPWNGHLFRVNIFNPKIFTYDYMSIYNIFEIPVFCDQFHFKYSHVNAQLLTNNLYFLKTTLLRLSQVLLKIGPLNVILCFLIWSWSWWYTMLEKYHLEKLPVKTISIIMLSTKQLSLC